MWSLEHVPCKLVISQMNTPIPLQLHHLSTVKPPTVAPQLPSPWATHHHGNGRQQRQRCGTAYIGTHRPDTKAGVVGRCQKRQKCNKKIRVNYRFALHQVVWHPKIHRKKPSKLRGWGYRCGYHSDSLKFRKWPCQPGETDAVGMQRQLSVMVKAVIFKTLNSMHQ